MYLRRLHTKPGRKARCRFEIQFDIKRRSHANLRHVFSFRKVLLIYFAIFLSITVCIMHNEGLVDGKSPTQRKRMVQRRKLERVVHNSIFLHGKGKYRNKMTHPSIYTYTTISIEIHANIQYIVYKSPNKYLFTHTYIHT